MSHPGPNILNIVQTFQDNVQTLFRQCSKCSESVQNFQTFSEFLAQKRVYSEFHVFVVYVISVYHHWCCEFESRSGRDVQHYVIKFVSDLRQVGGFLRILWFPPQYNWNIVESGIKHHQTNKLFIKWRKLNLPL